MYTLLIFLVSNLIRFQCQLLYADGRRALGAATGSLIFVLSLTLAAQHCGAAVQRTCGGDHYDGWQCITHSRCAARNIRG